MDFSKEFYVGRYFYDLVWEAFQSGALDNFPNLPLIQKALDDRNAEPFRSMELALVHSCLDYLETQNNSSSGMFPKNLSFRHLILAHCSTARRQLSWYQFFLSQESNSYFIAYNEGANASTVTVYFATPVHHEIRSHLEAIPRQVEAISLKKSVGAFPKEAIDSDLSSQDEVHTSLGYGKYSQMPIQVSFSNEVWDSQLPAHSEYEFFKEIYQNAALPNRKWTHMVLESMESNLNMGRYITLSATAKELGCAPSSLQRYLLAQKQSFRSLRGIFLGAQSALFLRTDLSIIEIASRMGYNNLTSFNTAFSRFWKESPTSFRDKARIAHSRNA